MKQLLGLLIVMINIGSFTAQNSTEEFKKKLSGTSHDTSRCKIIKIIAENEDEADSIWKYIYLLKYIAEKNIADPSQAGLKNKFIEHFGTHYNYCGFMHTSYGTLDSALYYYQKALQKFESCKNLKEQADCLNNIALTYHRKGKLELGLEFYLKAKTMREEIGDWSGVSQSYCNIGGIYLNQGDFARGVDSYMKGLAIAEKIKNDDDISVAFYALAALYHKQKDYERAKKYYDQGFKITEKLGNFKMMGDWMNNIGHLHMEKKEYQKALECFQKCMDYMEKAGDQETVAAALSNTGIVYARLGNPAKAKEFLEKAMHIYEKMDSKDGLSSSLSNLAEIYFNENENSKAGLLAKKALKVAEDAGIPEQVMNSSLVLYRVYKKSGNTNEALKMYETYIRMRDSVNSIVNKKAAIASQFKYEYDKKATADSVAYAGEKKLKEAEIATHQAEIKAGKNKQVALFGGLAMLLVFSGFIYNRFKVTRKQNVVIEEQKQVLEEKQREILDSIHYAKRIQMALIPNENSVARRIERVKPL